MSYCVIKADLTLCRDAWLDSNTLAEWLAEAASIRGSDFILTSRLPNISGRHRIVKQDDHRLEFDWFVDGCETKLTIDFQNSDGQTRVEVRHEFPDPIPIGLNFPGGKHYGDQVWDHALYQLKSLLETGKKSMTLPWPDNAHQIEHEITIHAPASKIWEFLVDANQLKRLNLGGTEPIVEPGVGGRYSFGWIEEESQQVDGPGHITEWVEHKKLSHTWYGGRDSVISYDFHELNEGVTLLRFKHTGLIFSYAETWSYKLGWADHLLQMKSLLEEE
ncbi:MAG: SRPBCC family protein [Luteolibacter sp.]